MVKDYKPYSLGMARETEAMKPTDKEPKVREKRRPALDPLLSIEYQGDI